MQAKRWRAALTFQRRPLDTKDALWAIQAPLPVLDAKVFRHLYHWDGSGCVQDLSPRYRRCARFGSYGCHSAFVLSFSASFAVSAQQISEFDTAFELLGPDCKIVVKAFDDPKVAGVTCYISRFKAGGVTGALGLATEKSRSAIACRRVGPISSTVPIPKSEQVFSESLFFLFKKLRIVRMVDPAQGVLLYLTYSDKLIDGSPENSLTAAPLNGAKLQFK